jgi:hypothetical protein
MVRVVMRVEEVRAFHSNSFYPNTKPRCAEWNAVWVCFGYTHRYGCRYVSNWTPVLSKTSYAKKVGFRHQLYGDLVTEKTPTHQLAKNHNLFFAYDNKWESERDNLIKRQILIYTHTRTLILFKSLECLPRHTNLRPSTVHGALPRPTCEDNGSVSRGKRHNHILFSFSLSTQKKT